MNQTAEYVYNSKYEEIKSERWSNTELDAGLQLVFTLHHTDDELQVQTMFEAEVERDLLHKHGEQNLILSTEHPDWD